MMLRMWGIQSVLWMWFIGNTGMWSVRNVGCVTFKGRWNVRCVPLLRYWV